MLPLVFIRLIFQNERSSFEEKIPFHEKKKKKKKKNAVAYLWGNMHHLRENNYILHKKAIAL